MSVIIQVSAVPSVEMPISGDGKNIEGASRMRKPIKTCKKNQDIKLCLSVFRQLMHAFTLLELLVVISIITILVALLLPALTKVKEKGRQITCGGNLNQFGKAFTMYSSDYNDLTPPIAVSWNGVYAYWDLQRTTGGYLGISVPAIPWDFRFKCLSTGISENGYKPDLGYIISYGGNVKMQLYKISKINNPSSKLIVKDQSSRVIWSAAGLDPASDSNAIYRHSNGANILFVDGHTGWNKKDWIVNNRSQIADN